VIALAKPARSFLSGTLQPQPPSTLFHPTFLLFSIPTHQFIGSVRFIFGIVSIAGAF
jgi:hypothetical protein